MLGISDIKTGKNVILNGTPFAVIYHEHSKMGRAGSVLRTRLKNILTGAVLEKTFQGAEQVKEANISKDKAQFLYREGDMYFFMDNANFDQFSLPKEVLGNTVNYLIEGTEIIVLNFNNLPVNIELPVKITLRVIEAPPGIKGNTASGADKLITLETGLKISAPLFINVDDQVIVNTEKNEYVSRA